MLKIEIGNGKFNVEIKGRGREILADLTVATTYVLNSALEDDAPKEAKDDVYNTFIEALMYAKDNDPLC